MHNTPVPAICPGCSGHYVLQSDLWTYRCDNGCGELAVTDVYLEHDETISDVTINGRVILAVVTLDDTSDEDEI